MIRGLALFVVFFGLTFLVLTSTLPKLPPATGSPRRVERINQFEKAKNAIKDQIRKFTGELSIIDLAGSSKPQASGQAPTQRAAMYQEAWSLQKSKPEESKEKLHKILEKLKGGLKDAPVSLRESIDDYTKISLEREAALDKAIKSITQDSSGSLQ